MGLTTIQQEQLSRMVRGTVRLGEPMRQHTTIQVGGPADAWVEPADGEELAALLRWATAEGIPWCNIGRGSNLLIRDGGIRGLAVHIGALCSVRIEEGQSQSAAVLYAEGGAKLKRLLGLCAEEGLAGLEGLEGIPGTVGGALVMNAGTPAGCIGDAVLEVIWCDRTGKLVTRSREAMEFGYRRAKVPRQAVIVAARLSVSRSSPDAVRARLETLRANRQAAQPGHQPSLGSIFKNPGGKSAWQLIEEAGLKGVRVGGARVANQHGNWIVNEGGATAKDVEVLIRLIRERVKESSGILLEPEIVMMGEELQ
ncbi:MAG: UDP-N-acetylmuramate dehydrogenase [Deltaproteobacteria bacterium]|nr:UDP-N-acetylmuramate dehydrogenase [Deltaproteobacteria bacterium]